MDKKVLMIGIDAATFDLINPWIEDLPNIKKLINTGTSGELLSIPPITAAAWTSAATGKNPGKHGLYEFFKRKKDSYFDLFPLNSQDRKSKAIWNILSDANKKVIILHYPMTYPPEEVNGIMVSDILTTPGIESAFTYPLKLKDELIEKIDEFKITLNEKYREGNEDSFLKDVEDLTFSQANTALYLMKNYEWDFFFMELHGIDLVCHFFWRYMDPNHPSYDLIKSEKYRDVIFRMYRQIDTLVGKILGNIENNTGIIIMSDHGAGPVYKNVNLNNFLLRKGMMKVKKNVVSQIKYWFFKRGFTVDNCRKLIPKKILMKHFKKPKNGKMDENINDKKIKLNIIKKFSIMNPFFSNSDIDWSKTKAYSIGVLSPIYINLKGREPEGIIEQGKEYDSVIEDLINELHTLKDPETNEHIVDYVLKRNDCFTGQYAYEAPDLAVIMKNLQYLGKGNHTGVLTSFQTNKLFEPTHNADSATGTHRMNGVIILNSDYIKQKTIINDAKIADVAANVLYMMGLPIPRDMDGKILTDAYEDSYLKSNPIRYLDSTEETQNDKVHIKDDEAIVKERLKSLGYLS